MEFGKIRKIFKQYTFIPNSNYQLLNKKFINSFSNNDKNIQKRNVTKILQQNDDLNTNDIYILTFNVKTVK